MRNTLQYPITKEEVISAIDQAVTAELDKRLIGGITPAALIKAKEFISQNAPDFFYESFDPRSSSND